MTTICGISNKKHFLFPLLLVVAAAACSQPRQRFDLLLSDEGDFLILEVHNTLKEPLVLPLDLINGPRDPLRSIYIKVLDDRGVVQKRCSFQELSPEDMSSAEVRPGERMRFKISKANIQRAYCMNNAVIEGFLGDASGKVDVKSNSVHIVMNGDGRGKVVKFKSH